MAIEPAIPLQDTRELRLEIIAACHTLRKWGHFVGTWGNISVRTTEGFLITPSGVRYESLHPEDLVAVSRDCVKLSGPRLPSSETILHWMVLERRPEVGAVIHNHAPCVSTLAAAHRTLPPVVEDMAQIIAGEARCIEYTEGGKHIELAEAVCDAMGDIRMAALIANHGAVVAGRTLIEAVTASEVLEKAAFLFLSAEHHGGCMTIPPDSVERERYRFLYEYGKVDVTETESEKIARCRERQHAV